MTGHKNRENVYETGKEKDRHFLTKIKIILLAHFSGNDEIQHLPISNGAIVISRKSGTQSGIGW